MYNLANKVTLNTDLALPDSKYIAQIDLWKEFCIDEHIIASDGKDKLESEELSEGLV